nr:PAS domain S-box protein [uncultured Methanospirillum sp.]
MIPDQYRILYVDDDEELLSIGKLFLELSSDFSVDVISSPTEALKGILSGSYHAVVSDYEMPALNGIELLRQIREYGNNIPFIIFTGRGREDVVIEALNSGADFYLQKGGEPRSEFVELSHKIRSAIERREAIDALKTSRRQFSEMISALPDPTFAIDRDHRVIAWNRAIEQFTGIAAADIIGLSGYAYSVPFTGSAKPMVIDLILDEIQEVADEYLEFKREGDQILAENFFHLPFGERYLRIHAGPLYSKGMQVTGAIATIRDITDQFLSELELRNFVDTYQYIADYTADWEYWENPDKQIIYCSPTALTITGYANTEFVQNHDLISQIVLPDDQRIWQNHRHAQKDSQESDRVEFRIITRDGEIRWIEHICIPVLGSYGAYIGRRVSNRDITERKHAEEAIRENESRLRTLINAMPDIICFKDAQGRWIEANDFDLQLFQLEGIDYKHKTDSELAELNSFYRDAFLTCERSDEEAWKAGTDVRGIEFIPCPDGSDRVFDIIKVPTFHENGSRKGLVVIGRDITDLYEAQQALKKSEHEFRNIFDNAALGIFQTTPEGVNRALNPAFARIFGYDSPKQMVEEVVSIGDQVYVNPEERREFVRILLETGSIEGYEVEMFRKDKTRIWISLYARKVQEGEEVWFEGTIEDITARKRAEHELFEAYANLQAANEELISTEEELKRQYETNENNLKDLLETQSRFRDLFFSSPIGHAWFDPDGRLIEINQACLDIFGISSQEDVKGFWLWSDPNLPEDICVSVQAGEVRRFELLFDFELIRAENLFDTSKSAAIYLEMVISPIQNLKTNVNDGFLVHVQDITTKKSLEKTLIDRIVALTQPLNEPSSIQFSDLFNIDQLQQLQDAFAEATQVASLITLPDGTWVTQPSNFCRLCKDIIRNTEKGKANCLYSDQSIGRFHPSGPLLQPCLSGGLWDAAANITIGGNHIASWFIGQVKNEDIDEEKILAYADEIGADRTQFREALAEVPKMSREQFEKVVSILSLFTNELSSRAYQNVQQARFISERQRAESALKRANEQINLLASITRHDIRNKLTAMIAYLVLIKENPHAPECITYIEKIEQITNTIRNQIEFTRVYQDLGSHEPLWQKVNDILPYQEIPPEIIFETNVADLEIYADPMLAKVFQTLLDNSIRHGERVTAITVSYNLKPAGCRVIWEDNGVGIAEDEKSSVFERGFGKNTGLGLFLAKEILTITGIGIHETGIPGEGARFEILVPPEMFRVRDNQL